MTLSNFRTGFVQAADARLNELVARQNADGGWSADVDRKQPSDAFATGMSLYAISPAGRVFDAAGTSPKGSNPCCRVRRRRRRS